MRGSDRPRGHENPSEEHGTIGSETADFPRPQLSNDSPSKNIARVTD